ncbi:MAG: TIGR02710 family CRISPR-associated CARF protein [candidate division WOR-3 bacterium]
MAKAVLISVGGSQNPIIYSLKQQKPEYIIFFASVESEKQIPQILQMLKEENYSPKKSDQIITSFAEKFDECYEIIKKELDSIIKRWGLQPQDIIVDFTGGTKAMSVALVLATIDLGCKYSYVGGTERDKEGLGVVIDGKEKILYSVNPWDELAVEERKKISILFNKARYASAIELLEVVCKKVSQPNFYEIMIDIAKAYDNWDRFKHSKAKDFLFKGIKRFKDFLAGSQDKKLEELYKKLEENKEFLLRIVDEKDKKALVCDLIANAERRAKLENKYDDALARLYRAVEMIAQNRLLEKYSIKTNDVDLSKVPENLKQKFKERYLDPRDNKIKIGLKASYELLKEKKDNLGEKFWNDKRLVELLDIRNNTILAHGTNSVEKETYEELLGHLLELAEIKINDLPQFPTFDL